MSAPDQKTLREASTWLAARDNHLATAHARVGVPAWRTAPPTYETLARAVVYQLISLQAAEAIWGRTQAQVGADFSAEAVLACDPETLRSCGLSRPKVAHMRSIAQAFVDGHLDAGDLAGQTLEQARKVLLAVSGIGPWTANLFLMNALGHLDAFPAGDVGVMEAYRQISQREVRHNTREFNELAESWQPYRGVAAHLLWAWLHAERDANRA